MNDETKPPQCQEQLEQLAIKLSDLDKLTCALTQKLTPILSPEAGVTELQANKSESPIAPLAESIKSRKLEVGRLIDRIGELICRAQC